MPILPAPVLLRSRNEDETPEEWHSAWPWVNKPGVLSQNDFSYKEQKAELEETKVLACVPGKFKGDTYGLQVQLDPEF